MRAATRASAASRRGARSWANAQAASLPTSARSAPLVPREGASEPQAPIRTKAQAGRAFLRRAASRPGGTVVAALHICGYAPRIGCVGRAPPAGGARIQDRMATIPESRGLELEHSAALTG